MRKSSDRTPNIIILNKACQKNQKNFRTLNELVYGLRKIIADAQSLRVEV